MQSVLTLGIVENDKVIIRCTVLHTVLQGQNSSPMPLASPQKLEEWDPKQVQANTGACLSDVSQSRSWTLLLGLQDLTISTIDVGSLQGNKPEIDLLNPFDTFYCKRNSGLAVCIQVLGSRETINTTPICLPPSWG